MPLDVGPSVWDMSVEEFIDHSFCDSVTILLHLFSNVLEKSVTGPATYHRDGVDQDLVRKY